MKKLRWTLYWLLFWPILLPIFFWHRGWRGRLLAAGYIALFVGFGPFLSSDPIPVETTATRGSITIEHTAPFISSDEDGQLAEQNTNIEAASEVVHGENDPEDAMSFEEVETIPQVATAEALKAQIRAATASQQKTNHDTDREDNFAEEVSLVVTATIEPAPLSPSATANSDANLRAGPGTTFDIVAGIPVGEPLDVVARNELGDWYQLANNAWIWANLVDNAPSELPVAQNIPTPPPTATPAPFTPELPPSTPIPAFTPTPKPTSDPLLAFYRVGAICWDGWQSSATGRGACSHHGGVYCWIYADGSCRSK